MTNTRSFSISAAALILGASALASRFLGIIRERLLVGHFGIGDTLDAYYASFQVPNFLFNLLILGTLSVAFIPVFTEYLEKQKKADAWRVANTILSLTIILMGALCFVLALFAPLLVRLIAPGFSGDKLQETIALTRIMMISPWLFAISSVFGSVLNSFKRFAAAACAPLIYNLAIILGIILFAPRFGIYGVAGAVVAGALLHMAIQIPWLLQTGFRPRAALHLAHPGVREIGKLFFPRIWGIDISQLALLVGSIIGSTLAAGSVALFNLTVNIAVVPVGVFAVSYAVAVFPVLSAAAARGDRETFVTEFSRTGRQILFFTVPIGVMMIVLRAHIVRLILGTENLSWNDTRLAAAALALFVVSLFLQGLVPLLARAYYAMKNTLIPVVVSAIALVFYIASAYGFLYLIRATESVKFFFIKLLRIDFVPDISMLALPLAFSVATAVQVIILIIMYRRKFGRLDGREIARSFGKIFVASLGAGIFTYGGLYLAEGFGQSRTFVGILIQAGLASILGAASYLAIALVLQSNEARIFVGSLQRKLFRAVRPPSSQDVDTIS